MSTFLLMQHTSRKMVHRIHELGGFGDLTHSQFYTLMALQRHKDLPLNEISGCIRRSPGNMTLVVDNLEKAGWVERVRSKEDRRVILVHLTESGKEKSKAAKKENARVIESLMSELNEEEINTLSAILLKLNNGELNLPEI
ncbi:MAG: MarR family transcriptional regulator [Anaerolineaceae bacterium]|nr:MarR family transcriptional regulator [Anaerolineaceae bacterium]